MEVFTARSLHPITITMTEKMKKKCSFCAGKKAFLVHKAWAILVELQKKVRTHSAHLFISATEQMVEGSVYLVFHSGMEDLSDFEVASALCVAKTREETENVRNPLDPQVTMTSLDGQVKTISDKDFKDETVTVLDLEVEEALSFALILLTSINPQYYLLETCTENAVRWLIKLTNHPIKRWFYASDEEYGARDVLFAWRNENIASLVGKDLTTLCQGRDMEGQPFFLYDVSQLHCHDDNDDVDDQKDKEADYRFFVTTNVFVYENLDGTEVNFLFHMFLHILER
jgi:hypothetical protein